MKHLSVSVLGCGWLGFPLAESLAHAGHDVRGSTTSPDKAERLSDAGVHSHRIVVAETVEGEDLAAFFGADVVICTVPPGRSEVAYPDQMSAVRDAAGSFGAGWVILTSSTSVYPNLDAVVEESDAGAREGVPLRRNGEAVLAAERVLWGRGSFDTTVLRLAGLYGYGRHPARYFAGKDDLSGGGAPVNLVHRDDVIRAVHAVLEHDARGAVFNVCADHHPTRRRIYTAEAERLGLALPTFNGSEADGYKIVSNARIRERLDFRFAYADPMTPAP